MDLGLDVVNRVGRLDLQRDSLSGQGLDENLHSSAKAQDKVKSGLLLDVIIRKSAAIFELLSSEDQALLVRRNSVHKVNIGGAEI